MRESPCGAVGSTRYEQPARASLMASRCSLNTSSSPEGIGKPPLSIGENRSWRPISTQKEQSVTWPSASQCVLVWSGASSIAFGPPGVVHRNPMAEAPLHGLRRLRMRPSRPSSGTILMQRSRHAGPVLKRHGPSRRASRVCTGYATKYGAHEQKDLACSRTGHPAPPRPARSLARTNEDN